MRCLIHDIYFHHSGSAGWLPSMPSGILFCTQMLLVSTSWQSMALTSFQSAILACCRQSWMQTLSAPSWPSFGGHLASRWAGP